MKRWLPLIIRGFLKTDGMATGGSSRGVPAGHHAADGSLKRQIVADGPQI
jgi:hypothetical protein